MLLHVSAVYQYKELGEINTFLFKVLGGLFFFVWLIGWLVGFLHTRSILLKVSKLLKVISLLKLEQLQGNLLYKPSYFPILSIFNTTSLNNPT